MDSIIEEKSIKPVNKLRERFEALATSSSSIKPNASYSNNGHEEESLATHGGASAPPQLAGLYNLRTVSASSSSFAKASIPMKSSESDTSNDEVVTPGQEVPTPTQDRAASPSTGRKLTLKPPPPPPPDRSGTLRNQASTDSVGSLKKPASAGVHRKPPPPPPPFLGSPHGHAASLSVGDLVSQLSIGNGAAFRSLDTSPITTPTVLQTLDGQIRRSPSPAPPEMMNALPPRPTLAPPTPPTHTIRINIPESIQPQLIHTGAELSTIPRSPMKPLPPPRVNMNFAASTPSSPAPPLPSRTSPDQQGVRNTVIHHSLSRRTDVVGPSETDEFGVDVRSPPPRHHSLNSRTQPPATGKGAPPPPPPPPPRPSSMVSFGLSNSSPSVTSANSLIHVPPPLPNRRSNPNLRADDLLPVTNTLPSASAPPAPPLGTKPTSSSWGRLAASAKSGLLKTQQALLDHDTMDFKPPPPPTRTIAPGDKLPPARRHSGDESSDGSEDEIQIGQTPVITRRFQDDMPDSSQSRRHLPKAGFLPEVHISPSGAIVAVSGFWICVAHTNVCIYNTRDTLSPMHVIDLEHMGIEWRAKEPRVTAMEFRAADNQEDDGRFLWCGTKDGHLFELDIQAGICNDVLIPSGGHSLTVTHILRYGRSMLTMDESGKIIFFDPPANQLTPSLSRFTRSHRAAEKQSFVKILGGHLWTSYGSGSTSINHTTRGPPFRTYDVSSSTFATKHLFATEPVGPALCGTIVPEEPNLVYIGHEGGSVTVWKYDVSTNQHICVKTIKISASSITCMEGVSSRLWFGTRSGTITVCEIRETSPWIVTNQWQAHGDSPVVQIAVDPYSIAKIGKLIVYSMGRDDYVRFWDGLLEANWIDEEMQRREQEYSTYRDVKVLVCTWNIDSAKPDALAGTEANRNFFGNLLERGNPPDIIVFGFQEVIDLENKKLTAKTVLLGSQKSKTEGKISEKVSRSYKLWYDRLVYAVRVAYDADNPYIVIHSENLVGLFSCIFVRKSESISLADPAITTVKRGMKGRYGNKGAIIARFTMDDTSFCFLNCHLAAGQKHIRERNQDVASILEEKSVFPMAVHDMAPAAFVGGGDGSMVLDHEVVFLNGDLNYRIDQRREQVINCIHAGELDVLLGHDQLLKEMQNNPGFRLRSFNEAPITFVPTYKYDRGSDEFDSSEKRRIPAWCDRILFRSRGNRVYCEDYRRLEPNVSDHKPVSGTFKVNVKSVRRDAWSIVKAEVQGQWEQKQEQLLWTVREFYTSNHSRLLV